MYVVSRKKSESFQEDPDYRESSNPRVESSERLPFKLRSWPPITRTHNSIHTEPIRGGAPRPVKHSEGGNAERRTSSVAGNAKGQMVGVVRG